MARYVTNPILGNINNAAERQTRLFFYGQDTYRATSKLTLNYGLRWEIYTPESVLAKGYGGFANIIDNGGTGVIRVAGYGGIRLERKRARTIFTLSHLASESPTSSLRRRFVRMGYGRSYDIGVFGSNFGHTVTQNLPVLIKQNIDASSNPLTAGVPIPTIFRCLRLHRDPLHPSSPRSRPTGKLRLPA